MPRIQALTPAVVNKIAAGEVIERPASVVKELLENSVDALATRIEVDIEEGGVELIRIVDDGEGIHPEDLPLAVASHATSKLREADDLFKVQTLGFRGEALASIAEVSRLRIRSRPADCDSGNELEVNCGTASPVKACGCPFGTQMEVAQLFINTPVRRKFLKTTSTEFGHIAEQFTKVALANPRIHMVLRHNGKTVYEVPATENLLERITLFYGGELAQQLIPVESAVDAVRLWGYVGHPSISKSTRKGEWLFLNGRWIQDRALQHALSEGYRGLLMVGRNPICFLFLELPADQVDVNVHPTKCEVRFREAPRLYRQLLTTLRSTFTALDLDSVLKLDAPQPRPSADPLLQQQAQKQLVAWVESRRQVWEVGDQGPRSKDQDSRIAGQQGGVGEQRYGIGDPVPSELDAPSDVDHVLEGARDPGPLLPDPDSPLPDPRSLPPLPVRSAAIQGLRAMQIHDSYLVVETEEGLQVVDQHALHERILYEQIRRRILEGGVESQRLLIPEPVEVTATEAELLRGHAAVLRQLGLSVEDFGGNTVVVTAYPVLLRRVSPPQILREVLDELLAEGRGPSRRDLLDGLMHMMSCKAAVKAGMRLAPEEIESLLAWRHLVDDAHHCPHGRPTALKLSRAELDRQFGRLG